MTIEEMANTFAEDVWPKVTRILSKAGQVCVEAWECLPIYVDIALLVIAGLALTGVMWSLVKAICLYFTSPDFAPTWKPAHGSKRMLRYFGGTGQYQRKRIHHLAQTLLCDHTWLWVSVACLTYRFGNRKSESRTILFLESIVYLPGALIGGVEMLLRIAVGSVLFFLLNVVIAGMFFLLGLVTKLIAWVFRLTDHSLRHKQHCPHCYTAFRLPAFLCPYCGESHTDLIPGRCGILYSKGQCGHFIPCSILSGRNKLTAVCPNPQCETMLDTTNARQFFIQIIGGGSVGKTAFSAAFQHMYGTLSNGQHYFQVAGEPVAQFAELERMYTTGEPESDAVSTVTSYDYVHRKHGEAVYGLIMYDIPGDMILGESYERNPLNFGYADGFMVLLDPLSTPALRKACGHEWERSVAEEVPVDDTEHLIVEFINKYSEITGRAARKMSNVPVAVLITKSDVQQVKSRIGMPQIKAQYQRNREQYHHDETMARDEICRSFLMEIGLSNVVNHLESVFTDVRYFPMSAVGHTPTVGEPFEPFGVIEPVAWIAQMHRSPLYPTLKFAQEQSNKQVDAHANDKHKAKGQEGEGTV